MKIPAVFQLASFSTSTTAQSNFSSPPASPPPKFWSSPPTAIAISISQLSAAGSTCCIRLVLFSLLCLILQVRCIFHDAGCIIPLPALTIAATRLSAHLNVIFHLSGVGPAHLPFRLPFLFFAFIPSFSN